MAITSTTNKVTYTGNAVASVFPYAFKIFANTELEVDQILISTEAVTRLALTTDYTVSGVDSSTGGNVTLVAGALSALYKLTIRRVLPLTQLVDFIENDSAPAETFEESYDRDTMIAQQLQETVDRCIKMKVYTSGVTVEIPDPQAGYYLGWNSTATALENKIAISLGDADLDTDGTLAANSDTRVASQKATKTYVGNSIAINTETAKTPVHADIVSIEDSAATWARKKATLAKFGEGLIHNATLKETPVNADEVLISDSEASNVVKKATLDKMGLWIVDGTETQLKTADELDMQTKRITAMGDPTTAQDAVTRDYLESMWGGQTVTAGSATVTKSDDVCSVRSSGLTKQKEIVFPHDGAATITFKYWTLDGSWVKAHLYRNGSTLSGEQASTSAGSWITYTAANSTGWTKGDLCQVYCSIDNPGATKVGGIKDFQVGVAETVAQFPISLNVPQIDPVGL